MGQNLVSPTIYMRRQMSVVAGGMAVLTLVTWGISGALGSGQAAVRPPNASSAAAARATAAGHGSARHGPASRHGSGRGHRGRPASKPSQSSGGQTPRLGTGSNGHQTGLSGDTTDLRSRSPASPRPSAGASDGSGVPGHASGCAHGGVVLTLRTSRYRFTAGRVPTFVVDAVSTGSRRCRVNLGSRFMSVVVASGGTPLWDSASCPRGTGSRVVTLSRGVPAYFHVTWDRRTSISGCQGRGSLVPSGQYTVAAFDGQIRSQNVTFALAR
jgi:hypothetical protein